MHHKKLKLLQAIPELVKPTLVVSAAATTTAAETLWEGEEEAEQEHHEQGVDGKMHGRWGGPDVGVKGPACHLQMLHLENLITFGLVRRMRRVVCLLKPTHTDAVVIRLSDRNNLGDILLTSTRNTMSGRTRIHAIHYPPRLR